MIHEIDIIQFLNLTQFNKTNIKGCSVTQTLQISESYRESPFVRSVKSILNIGQTIKVRYSIRNLSVSDTLLLYDHGAKGPPTQVITQLFFPYQHIYINRTGNLIQTINLSQNISYNRSKGVYHTLVMTESFIYSIVRNLAITQTLVMESGAIGQAGETCGSTLTQYTLNGPNSAGGDI